ncbi:MAG TPA: hypothetical protein PLP17_11920 [Oligoflexia bacterium]|nr:hypothetical protein [Oligoflexia bacterium]
MSRDISQDTKYMKASSVLFAATLICLLSPVSARAQVECAGSLTQENFYPEIKELNTKIQKNLIAYRKLESDHKKLAAGSTEANAAEKRLTALKSELQEQKKTFEQLNSRYFPTTPLTALGAACSDMRWAERAKAILIKHPEKLGKRYFVWIDAVSQEIKASEKRPSLDTVAK